MKFITPMIIGGIIGYFTNWLAIKMLFRPYEEKRIFGIKVPFTPGLIPKERHRMAKSVGDTVSNYLLTPEKITELLKNENIKISLNSFFENEFDKLKKEDKLLIDYFEDKESVDIYKSKYSEKISGIIVYILKKETTRIKLIEIINREYDNIFKNISNYIQSNTKLYINSILDKKVVSNVLDNIIELSITDENCNLSIKDYIDNETYIKIKEIVKENDKLIYAKILELLKEDNTKVLIEKTLEKAISENISPLITTFISTNSIRDKALKIFYKYIEKDEAKDICVGIVNILIDKVLDIKLSKVKETISLFIEEKEKEIISIKIIEIIKEYINENKLYDKISFAIEDILKNNKTNIVIKICNNIEKLIDGEKFKLELENIINSLFDNVLNLEISDIISKINIKTLVDLIYRFINQVDTEVITKIFKLANISKIVEEQINSFEIEFGEKLILDIAEKELKAITNLGAVLGALIGVLSPFIQML